MFAQYFIFCRQTSDYFHFHSGGYWAVLWRPRGGFWRGPCQEFSGGGGDLMFWEKISLLLLTIFEYTSSLGKYHSLLSISSRKLKKVSRRSVYAVADYPALSVDRAGGGNPLYVEDTPNQVFLIWCAPIQEFLIRCTPIQEFLNWCVTNQVCISSCML